MATVGKRVLWNSAVGKVWRLRQGREFEEFCSRKGRKTTAGKRVCENLQ